MLQDLKDFLEKINEDEALQERMDKIIKESSPEGVFDNCNAVAKELGYDINQEDLQVFADEHKEDLSDEELDKVAGGTAPTSPMASVTVAASVVCSAVTSIILAVRKRKRSKRRSR